MALLTEAAVTVAVSQLGVREQGGNNRGPDVDLYLASVGLDEGSSWCAVFVYWCFRRASNMLIVTNPCPRTGGALKLWKLADAQFHAVTPTRGRVFVMDHGMGLGHVGFVEAVRGDGSIDTIAGNTNAEGSRNGDRVGRHTFDPTDGSHGKLVGYLDFDATSA